MHPTRRLFAMLLLLVALPVAGCREPAEYRQDYYAGYREAMVREQLGAPDDEFAGHYGIEWPTSRQTPGSAVKSFVYERPGGKLYMTFEERPRGWSCICSSWLPEGAVY